MIDTGSLNIGPIQLETPAAQAALSGYSDWPMRVMARRCGAAYSLHEVMIDQHLLSLKNRRRTRHLLRVTDEERPVGGQLMGADPEQFAAAAMRIVEAGFDVVDLNFGCPVKKVLGRCRGGFHLGQPQIALEIIERVRAVVPDEIPVTVKMRRGIDESSQSRDRFLEILEGAIERGVAAATVHGRTVEQRYRGPSRWEFLGELKRLFPEFPILGSGDLFSPYDCLSMMERTGVDGVSIARGSIGNPWIFGQLNALLSGMGMPPAPTIGEQRDVLLQHRALCHEVATAENSLRGLRKAALFYARSHPEFPLVRQAFIACRSDRDWLGVLDQFYSADGSGQYPPEYAEEPARPGEAREPKAVRPRAVEND